MNKKAEVAAPDTEVYFRFFNEVGIINQLSSTKAERVLPHGLTISQFSVLNHFQRGNPPRSPLELANAFQVTKGAMTNTLKQLEGKGFVAIVPHETDGRSKVVSITEEGRQAHKTSQGHMLEAFQSFAQAFEATEIASVIPMLERIRVWLDNNR